MIYKKGILDWCSSVERTFQPREDVPKNENSKQIPEQFLATTLRFLRAACAELPDVSAQEFLDSIQKKP